MRALRAGDRVRLSWAAVNGCVAGYRQPDRVGTVVRIVRRRGEIRHRSLAVRWDGNSSTTTYGEAWLDYAGEL